MRPAWSLILLTLTLACQTPGASKPGSAAPADDSATPPADEDRDGVPAGEDCDDTDPDVSPTAEEICDGLDNNCDGQVDEGLSGAATWPDEDGDGYGDHDSDPQDGCDGVGEGRAANAEDCDDGDAAVSPEAVEVCDGLDNDCDDRVDASDDSVADAGWWYTDGDGDGFGDDGSATLACDPPEGAVSQGGDCDDTDDAYNPDVTESDCTDPNDYNCDGSVGFADADGDGFAACEDCDDSSVLVAPGAEEFCDGLDNDCDGHTDEPDATDAGTWYADADGDGYGDAAGTVVSCDPPTGYSAAAGDCDDGDAAISPDGEEICDGLDNDCDRSLDEGFDADSDGITDCEEQSHDLSWVISADDAQTVYIDGVAIGAYSGWSTSDTITATLDSGPHALGVYAYDSGATIAGLIAAVSIDGVSVSLTGDGSWRWATSVTSDWADADFDDSSWSAASKCSSADVSKYWGTKPTDLTGAGASWVWYQSCTSLGAAYFRLSLTLD